jgi:alanine racemase
MNSSEDKLTDFDRLEAARQELAAIQPFVDDGRALEALIKELERAAGKTAIDVDNAFHRLVVRPREDRQQRALAEEMMEHFASE